jgi:tetratricopeptide (TPR) repeat protein
LPPRAALAAAGMLLVLGTASAVPLVPGPMTCALELSAQDASGNTVLQTVAYALDRPGLLLARLSPAARLRPRWERLKTAPDQVLSGPDAGRAPFDVTEVLLQDTARDLVLLRAPGLAACDAGDATGASARPDGAETAPAEGESLIGIRDRDGYLPRVFQARLDRTIATGDGPMLMKIQIADGGGAASGFVLDRRHHLIGLILPPPAGGDRMFACAVPIDRREFDRAAAGAGRPVSDALAGTPADDLSGTPAGLWAQALLLTRDDQADQALRLLDGVARLTGESDLLLIERGVRRFRIGRTDPAIEDFARAARLNPRLHLARFNLGVALGSAGRYAEAIDAFTRALEIDPGHAQTHYQLALALMAARQSDRARVECDSLEHIDPGLARDLRAALDF